ncbi:hypothetical protein KVP10_00570 [Candidimonas humi]|uniref:Pirin C-terminal cupin domain-containing protein n=1 Tax=Candidimonas humi TaxID=683355 RepID=A0ABV8NWI6_9BURK|nr:hypothetical protein [Candidimonas humi]MBV6303355.1 hypothetical protein [Candidimonas humi]
MIYAANSEKTLAEKFLTLSGSGHKHYRTDFLGRKGDPRIKGKPQAYLLDLNADEVLPPHFHIIDQFQVFFRGNGTLGRNADVLQPVSIHYADHHTGYGPIIAGREGFSYFTLRPEADPGAVYLHKEGYREKLEPSRKRHHLVQTRINAEPAVIHSGVTQECLVEKGQKNDAGITMLRMGADAHAVAPDPARSGGQYYLVLSGTLLHDGQPYPPLSVLFVDAAEPAFEVRAGRQGLEAAVMQFPDWSEE